MKIRASAEQIWRLLADPANLGRWNPNARCGGSHGALTEVGETFALTYRLRGRETAFVARVTAIERPRLLEIELASDPLVAGPRITERYEIREDGDGAELVQTIVLGRSGLPWWARGAVSLIHRIGEPTGKRYFEELRDLVESERP